MALTLVRVVPSIGARAYGRADALVIIANKGMTTNKVFRMIRKGAEGRGGGGDLPNTHGRFYHSVKVVAMRHVESFRINHLARTKRSSDRIPG